MDERTREQIAEAIDTLTSGRARAIYLVTGLTLGTLAIVWYGLRVLPFILFIIYALAFLFGLAFVPLLAMTVGPNLGAFIPERIANYLWIVSNLGVRRPVLEQLETDEYEVNRGERGLSPRSYWDRWALAPFGLTFEATREALAPAVADDDMRAEVENLEFNARGESTVYLRRGPPGTDWYVHKRDLDGILVPIGQKLAELRDAASPDIGFEAYAEALKQYGGDTSQYGNRTLFIGTLVFVALGAGMGWVVFF